MKIITEFNLRNFLLAAAFLAGLGGGTHASAQHTYLIDLNSRTARDLGALGRGFSVGYGINDAGQMVGDSATAPGPSHAFITGPNGVGMVDLNSLIDLPGEAVLNYAIAINNFGQVIAAAVPEPESYALLLAGLALIGAVLWRRKWIGSFPAPSCARVAESSF